MLLDLGSKTTGIIAKADLLDDNLLLKYQVGDHLEAYVISAGEEEITLSTNFSQSTSKADALDAAYRDQIPVTAKVTGTNKGGFELSVLGRKGFCPISQIDLSFVTNPDGYIGQDLEFLIQKLDKRDLVLSRSALLAKSTMRRLDDIKSMFEEHQSVQGTVSEVLDFGAVVDLGGINGFVHISEMGFKHLKKASEALEKGQVIDAKILKIDESKKHPRISLSLKALASDPWLTVENQFEVNNSYPGTVVRLADFGAFVELSPGVDGLIHLSQMSWEKKVHHPRDLMKEGDQVNVRITDINPLEKRISLSLKDLNDDPWLKVQEKYSLGSTHTGRVLELRPFGAMIELESGISALLPIHLAKEGLGAQFRKKLEKGAKIEVKITDCQISSRKIALSLPGQDDQGQEAANLNEYLQSQKQKKDDSSQDSTGSFGQMLEASLINRKG